MQQLQDFATTEFETNEENCNQVSKICAGQKANTPENCIIFIQTEEDIYKVNTSEEWEFVKEQLKKQKKEYRPFILSQE